MDPIAHTFVGASLAATGLRRTTPLATAALIIGANIPDVDVFASLGGTFKALAWRRGWTHGVGAMVVWPFLLVGLLLLYERWRNARGAQGPPTQPTLLLGIAALAVASHPMLDWLNNYGLRWLMPFDDRWFYGDALFIVDPWVWLLLGGLLFLAHSERLSSLMGWLIFWLASSLLVYSMPNGPARTVWTLCVLGLLALRFFAFGRCRPSEAAVRSGLALVAAYMLAAASLNIPARSAILDRLDAAALGPIEDIMVGPVPADPLGGTVIAATPSSYLIGSWHWLANPRFELSDTVITKRLDDPAVREAMTRPDVRDFLVWSRYPYAVIEEQDNARRIAHFRDARYLDLNRLWGPSVELDALD